ncbi:glycerol-3-phosphate dehydrogenase [Undibacterium piscinae]|uniref:Glycerol-3-phosphate dehydrogenase n=1 Tax=Undibacterium piscinae TaxID=2495591 RepID=A0A6M4A745_9BURK|nr:glycerol-3-phosphate dehydrogenase [Undibacterium piscinae]
MDLAQQQLECDVLVVGGGINGAGIARDAAGRGLSVILCEKDDLASHTSSASSKLIHGGLRYLEYYEFNLVRKALIEREVLMRSAPHIISPLRFVMPHMKGLRPVWMLRAGLFLYDHLARRELLPGSHAVDLRHHAAGAPLKANLTRGFMYSDGWVDDARLVVLNAMDAREKGATVLTRTTCQSVLQKDGKWLAQLVDANGDTIQVKARSLINATGSWSAQFQQHCAPQAAGKTLRLIKGSHIVVKRLFDHPDAYIFQHPDGRIVFAIPYEKEFTLIGTTDLDYRGDINQVAIEQQEISYLCQLSSLYFKRPIVPADVVWSYSGVRPLVDDGAADAKAITRDYRLELDQTAAPMLTVFGGKITTFRKLAEDAVDMLAPLLSNHVKSWTADACLPGGDLYGTGPDNRAVLEFAGFEQAMQQQYDWLPPALVSRYAHAYGTKIHQLLQDCHSVDEMGEAIAPGLYVREVRYLMQFEWARNATDILWRRSKLGLHLPANTGQKLNTWMIENP